MQKLKKKYITHLSEWFSGAYILHAGGIFSKENYPWGSFSKRGKKRGKGEEKEEKREEKEEKREGKEEEREGKGEEKEEKLEGKGNISENWEEISQKV